MRWWWRRGFCVCTQHTHTYTHNIHKRNTQKLRSIKGSSMNLRQGRQRSFTLLTEYQQYTQNSACLPACLLPFARTGCDITYNNNKNKGRFYPWRCAVWVLLAVWVNAYISSHRRGEGTVMCDTCKESLSLFLSFSLMHDLFIHLPIRSSAENAEAKQIFLCIRLRDAYAGNTDVHV